MTNTPPWCRMGSRGGGRCERLEEEEGEGEGEERDDVIIISTTGGT